MKKIQIYFVSLCFLFNSTSFANKYQEQAEAYVKSTLDEAKNKGQHLMNNLLLTELISIFNSQIIKDGQFFNEELSRKLKSLDLLTSDLQALNSKATLFKNVAADINAIDENLIQMLYEASSMFSHNVADMYIIENYVRQTSISINIIEAEYLDLTIRFLETLKTNCDFGMGMTPDGSEIPHFQVEEPKFSLFIDVSAQYKNENSTLSIDHSAGNAPDYKAQFRKQNPKTSDVISDGPTNDEKYAAATNALLNLAPTYIAGAVYSGSLSWMSSQAATNAVLSKAALTGAIAVVAISAAIYLHDHVEAIEESKKAVSASSYAFDHRATYEDVRQAFKEQCQIVQKILTPLPIILKGNISSEFIQEQNINVDKLTKYFQNLNDSNKALTKKENEIKLKHVDARLNSLNETDKNKLISYIKEKNLSDMKQEELKNIWLEENDKGNAVLTKKFSQFIKDFTQSDFDGNRLDAFKELTILLNINTSKCLEEIRASEKFKKVTELNKAMNPTELSGYMFSILAMNYIKTKSVADDVRKNLNKFENYFSKENKAILRGKSNFITYLANTTARQFMLNKNSSTFAQDINSSRVVGELYLELDQIIFKMAQIAFSANTDKSNDLMSRDLSEQQDRWYKKLTQAQEQFPKNNLLSNLKQHFQAIVETKNELN